MTKPRLNPNRSRLLKPEDLFVIDLSIPSFHISEVWSQIYDDSTSGHNWTVFSNCIEDQGSTILVVRGMLLLINYYLSKLHILNLLFFFFFFFFFYYFFFYYFFFFFFFFFVLIII